jgi:hypothetical protein
MAWRFLYPCCHSSVDRRFSMLSTLCCLLTPIQKCLQNSALCRSITYTSLPSPCCSASCSKGLLISHCCSARAAAAHPYAVVPAKAWAVPQPPISHQLLQRVLLLSFCELAQRSNSSSLPRNRTQHHTTTTAAVSTLMYYTASCSHHHTQDSLLMLTWSCHWI